MNRCKDRDLSGSFEIQQVINGGYCIGCGVCAAAAPSMFSMVMDEAGQWQATVQDESAGLPPPFANASLVCPFTNEGPNEDLLSQASFGDLPNHDQRLGYYHDLYAGYVVEGDYRERGSSGGVLTWLLTELMKRNQIDGVIQVKAVEKPEDGILFRYGISRSLDSIRAAAKSRYYPIELSNVLEQLRREPGRYALVGLPCFIKAVRRLMKTDPTIQNSIRFTVGLVCGHLKSKGFADSLGWQAGIDPGKLEAIDFRVKLPDLSAGSYGIRAKGNGIDKTKPAHDFLGSNWGHNFFRYAACDACDDVLAETADVVVGDAWIPPYESDSKGTSIVVVRNPELASLIQDAWRHGRLHLDRISPHAVAESQAGGLRDRREGLAYRLYLKEKSRVWHPEKRVAPTREGLSIQRKLVYRSREYLRSASHTLWREAVAKHDLNIFVFGMTRLIRRQERLSRIFRRMMTLLPTLLRKR